MATDDVANLLLRITGEADGPKDDLQDLGEKLKAFDDTKAEADVGLKGTDAVETDITKIVKALSDLGNEHADPIVGLQADGFKAEALLISQRIAELSAKEATPEVRVAIGQAVAQLAAVEKKIHDLDGQTANVSVNVDKDKVGRQSMESLAGGLQSLLGLSAKITALGFAAQGVGALGGTVAGLTGALGPATGALAGFAGIAVAAKQGMSVLKLGMTGTKGVFKDLTKTLQEPTPAINNFKENLAGITPGIVHLKNLAQGPILRGLTDGIRSASGNFGVLNLIVRETANAIGGIARKFGEFVGGKAFGKDLLRIGRTNTVVIGHLGDAAISLAKAFTDILIAAGPLIRWMARGISTFAESISATTALGRSTGTLGAFFEKTKTVMGIFGSILSNLGGIFSGVGRAAYDFGIWMITGIDGALGSLNKLTNSAKGQNALKDYFEQLKPAVTEFGKLLVDIMKGFAQLAVQPGLANLIKMIRTELLPALIEIVGATTQALGPALIKATAQFVNFIKPFIGSTGPLIAFVRIMGDIFGVMAKVMNSVPGATTALVAFVGAAGVFKATKLVGSVTGITSLVSTIRGLTTAQDAATASSVRSRVAAAATGVAWRLQAAATAISTAAQSLWTAATNTGILAAVRHRLAVIASTAAAYAARAAVAAWTAVQWLLNAALLANPIGLVVLAIAGLVTAFVLGWKHSETFRNIVTGAFKFVLGVVQSVWNWIKSNWPLLLAILTGPIGLAVATIIRYWDQIKAATTAVWNAIKSTVTGVVNAVSSSVRSVLGSLASAVDSIWTGVKASATAAWSAVKSAITGAVSGALGVIRGLFDRFVSIGGDVVDRIASGVSGAANAVKSAITGVVNRGVGAVTGLASDFFNAGKSLVTSIANGVTGAAADLYNRVKAMVGRIKDLLPGSEPKDPRSPLRGLKRSGAAIAENIAAGIPEGVARLTQVFTAELQTMPLVTGMAPRSMPPLSLQPSTPVARGTPNLSPSFTLKAFIGDTELKDVIRLEIEQDGKDIHDTWLAGVRP